MFQPVLPLGGLPGWALLNRTLERQTALFDATPPIRRDTEYFERTIGTVQTAADLVADRRLLRVALGAFGLEADINSQALIRKVLEGGTEAESALANRLSDRRYRQLADAFGFGSSAGARTRTPGFGREITDRYRRLSFETAVGAQDQALRLAMNARRELGEIAREDSRPRTKWLRILGTPPLRRVFEVALGLPQSFAQLDLDRQLETLISRSGRLLGIPDPASLAETEVQEALVRRFLLRDQISAVPTQSSRSIALVLLQSASGASG